MSAVLLDEDAYGDLAYARFQTPESIHMTWNTYGTSNVGPPTNN